MGKGGKENCRKNGRGGKERWREKWEVGEREGEDRNWVADGGEG